VKYKDFSPDIWQKIKIATAEAKRTQSQPVAAFDADGTLWDTDLGESFFDFLIDRKLVKLPEDPWAQYEHMKTLDKPAAYLWLAQICQNHPIETIRKWAQESVETFKPLPVFEPQKKLIEYFLSEGVRVFIVTASIKWAVEPGAKYVGLTPDDVIGIETHVKDGLVTDQQKGEISYREGKVKALQVMTQGQLPFFSTGNSEGDESLLESATHLSLAVSASRRDDHLFRTEANLLKLAQKKGWLGHRFVDDGP